MMTKNEYLIKVSASHDYHDLRDIEAPLTAGMLLNQSIHTTSEIQSVDITSSNEVQLCDQEQQDTTNTDNNNKNKHHSIKQQHFYFQLTVVLVLLICCLLLILPTTPQRDLVVQQITYISNRFFLNNYDKKSDNNKQEGETTQTLSELRIVVTFIFLCTEISRASSSHAASRSEISTAIIHNSSRSLERVSRISSLTLLKEGRENGHSTNTIRLMACAAMCLAGQYCSGTSCIDCTAGYYCPGLSSSGRVACPAGTDINGYYYLTIYLCIFHEGHTSAAGSLFCSPCAEGTYTTDFLTCGEDHDF